MTQVTESDGTTSDHLDILYTDDYAWFNTDYSDGKYEGCIKSGYDFNALKSVAEKIFGIGPIEE